MLSWFTQMTRFLHLIVSLFKCNNPVCVIFHFVFFVYGIHECGILQVKWWECPLPRIFSSVFVYLNSSKVIDCRMLFCGNWLWIDLSFSWLVHHSKWLQDVSQWINNCSTPFNYIVSHDITKMEWIMTVILVTCGRNHKSIMSSILCYLQFVFVFHIHKGRNNSLVYPQTAT